jgi:sugar/nucleoside kinase (ribokinase family)/DNA-binding CsgD family transcriptional regulator
MKLSENERLILELLRSDPYQSQQDLARKLDLSRPSVANLISGLQEKGIILGKPYVFRELDYVTCIGGANMDYTFRLEGERILGTSNPVVSQSSFGGVIRNVGENLARLGEDVSLMTLVGEDSLGKDLLSENHQLMEVFASEALKGETTGGYYSILKQDGNMDIGYADMAINEWMDRSWILRHKRHLRMSKYLVADTNVKQEALESLLAFSLEEHIPLAIVGVSSPKMKHMPDKLEGLDLLICNKDESQTYFHTKETSGEKLVHLWLKKGVKKVVVTAGDEGSYYGQDDVVKHQEVVLVKAEQLVDTTGAGDAFSGALLYGLIKGYSFEESMKLGASSASNTIQSIYSVDPSLSIDKIKRGEK